MAYAETPTLAAYIEHCPKSTEKNAATTHQVVVVGGKEVSEPEHTSQKEAKDSAWRAGYCPVHFARERHLQNRDIPDTFVLTLANKLPASAFA